MTYELCTLSYGPSGQQTEAAIAIHNPRALRGQPAAIISPAIATPQPDSGGSATTAPGEPLIGYDSGKLLGLFDPTLNGGYPRKQTHLVFLLIARFERGVQMIRPALSKFDNRINARGL